MPTTTQTPETPARAGKPTPSRATLLERIVNETNDLLIWMLSGSLDAIQEGYHDDRENAPAECFVFRTLLAYAHGSLSPASVGQDVADYEADVQNLKQQSAPDESNEPEAIGKRIREKLRHHQVSQARSSFGSWVRHANERDLLLMNSILDIANSNQIDTEYSAALLIGINSAFGLQDAVYCPAKYVPAVQEYVQRLTDTEVE